MQRKLGTIGTQYPFFASALSTFVSMERKKLFSQRTLPWLGKVEQRDRNIDRETERERV